MAEHTSSEPAEIGAEMDYEEHEKTYGLFVNITKYGTLACVALMIAMAWGFFVGGFISGTLLFVLICVAGAIFL